MALSQIYDLLNKVQTEFFIESNEIEDLELSIKNVNAFLNIIKIDHERVIQKNVCAESEDIILEIPSKEFKTLLKKVFEVLCEKLSLHLYTFPPKLIEIIISLFCDIIDLDILGDNIQTKNIFDLICDIIDKRNTVSIPLCFKLIGCICAENKYASECLLKDNMLLTLIQKFKTCFQVNGQSENSFEEKNEAIKTMQKISNKNDGILCALRNAGVSEMMIEYIGANYNKNDDVLFTSCVNLLQALLFEDQDNEELIRKFVLISFQIFVKCQIQENWKCIYQLIESLVVKFQSFAVLCVENRFFDDILHHLSPSFSSYETTETSTLLLNLLVLMTIPLDASKYLVEQDMDAKLTKLLDECNNKFKASFSLILGNFCFNDKMALKLVNNHKLHEKIILSLKQLFDSESIENSYVISYLSILKNLAVPIVNRPTIRTCTHFYPTIEKICLIEDPTVLQKLYIMLRITITKTDPSLTVALLENSIIFQKIVKCSHGSDSYILCRPSALLLLLTMIVNSKTHFENSNIITEELLCEVAKNTDPFFLATFYNNSKANEILFSILSEDNIKILLREQYFDQLYKLAVVPPYRPLLIINVIPAFKSLVDINGHVVEGKLKFIDDKFILALSSLINHPQLLEGLNLTLIIDQFKQIINSY